MCVTPCFTVGLRHPFLQVVGNVGCLKDVQKQMVKCLAAAVRQGLISVQEGICDALDTIIIPKRQSDGQSDGEPDLQLEQDWPWPVWIVSEYLKPGKPHVQLAQLDYSLARSTAASSLVASNGHRACLRACTWQPHT